MSLRQSRYYDLSSRLALLEDRRLLELLTQTETRVGWGKNQVINAFGSKIFSKSIPLTAREYERAYSTANHFDLPTFYNYGVGSAGFGAFRELATHVKTTNWVLSGAMENFPLMYHHRLLPRTAKAPTMAPDEIDKYVEYWNGSEAVRAYVEARIAASHELVIFLEFVPEVLGPWLPQNLELWPEVESQMLETCAFLRGQGVVHFDAHSHNILIGGKTAFLTDFGLALDREFDLSAEELEFHGRHLHFDAAEFLCALFQPLVQATKEWTPETKAKVEALYGDCKDTTLLTNLEELRSPGRLAMPESLADALLKYREILMAMDGFFGAMRKPAKDGKYDDGAIEAMLAQAALVP